MDVVPGRVELTNTHVCYYDDGEESKNSHDFKFSLEELREVYSRRYNLRKTAIEFFLLDRSSYFINFNQPKVRLGNECDLLKMVSLFNMNQE